MDTSAATRGAVLLVGSEKLTDWPVSLCKCEVHRRALPPLTECWERGYRLLPERGRRMSLRQTHDADGLTPLFLNGETG